MKRVVKMLNLETLQVLTYVVYIFAIIAYATLDGFDLGVGCLHVFAKDDKEKRLMINAIGPVWDGNTTWIVIGGGVLLAGFPKIYSIAMSNLYMPVMILLFAFMLRGAAIEFRGKRDEKKWRSLWDYVFFGSSLALALDIGLMLGNLVQGVPLNEKGYMHGGIKALISPYPILVAILGLSLFMMHGSIYLLMKTEGALHNRLRHWVNRLIVLFLILWVITTITTLVSHRHMLTPFYNHPELTIFALFSLFCILAIPLAISRRNDGWAFIFSCFSIVFLLILFVIGTFPNIVSSTINPEQNSLTLYNGSATKLSLTVLFYVALTGIPLSFFYGSYVYKVFRGKIKLDDHSY